MAEYQLNKVFNKVITTFLNELFYFMHYFLCVAAFCCLISCITSPHHTLYKLIVNAPSG